MLDEVYRSHFLSLLPFIKKRRKKIPHHQVGVIFHAAVCFVTGASFSIHHCCLYSLLNWLSLHPCRQTHYFLVIYRVIIGENIVLQPLLNIHSTNYSLCSSSFINLHTPKAWTLFASSFQIPAADDWTHLLNSVIPLFFL